MELIGKQIAIETILGQPPELHYPSWYAAQIEKLPPAPPEYLAEQAGILVTDADTISRAKAIEALRDYLVGKNVPCDGTLTCRLIENEVINKLPTAQPETTRRIVGKSKGGMTLWYECEQCREPVDAGDRFCRSCGRRFIKNHE